MRQELSVRQEATGDAGEEPQALLAYLHQKLLRIRCSLEVSRSRKLTAPERRQRSRDSTDGSCASVLPASAPCTTPQPALASSRLCVCLDVAVAPDGLPMAPACAPFPVCPLQSRITFPIIFLLRCSVIQTVRQLPSHLEGMRGRTVVCKASVLSPGLRFGHVALLPCYLTTLRLLGRRLFPLAMGSAGKFFLTHTQLIRTSQCFI